MSSCQDSESFNGWICVVDWYDAPLDDPDRHFIDAKDYGVIGWGSYQEAYDECVMMQATDPDRPEDAEGVWCDCHM
jgi:hypothetical protein